MRFDVFALAIFSFFHFLGTISGAEDLASTSNTSAAENCSLTLKVADTKGNPVKDASICVRSATSDHLAAMLQETDENGRCTVNFLEPTEYKIEIKHRRYLKKLKQLSITERKPNIVEIVLENGKTITGTIIETDGTTPDDITVKATSSDCDFNDIKTLKEKFISQEAEIASDGHFTIYALPDGLYDVNVEESGHRFEVCGKEKVNAGAQDLRIDLPEKRRIEFRVRDEIGTPLENVEILAGMQPIPAEGQIGRCFLIELHDKHGKGTDRAGMISLTFRQGHIYYLEFNKSGYLPAKVEWQFDNSAKENPPTDIAMSYGMTIKGKVLWEETRKPVDAEVICFEAKVYNNSTGASAYARGEVAIGLDGSFELEGVPCGKIYFGVSKKDGERLELTSQSVCISKERKSQELVILVPLPGTIVGEVFDKDGNLAIGREVSLSPFQEELSCVLGRKTVADSQGKFIYTLVPPGKFVVQTTRVDENSKWNLPCATAAKIVRLEPGMTTSVTLDEREWRQRPTKGRLFINGKPATAGTKITFWPANPAKFFNWMAETNRGETGRAVVGVEGAFSCGTLPQYSYCVKAGDEESSALYSQLEWEGKGGINIELKTVAVSGLVKLPQGCDIQDIEVRLSPIHRSPSGEYQSRLMIRSVTHLDKDGHFIFPYVSRGDYRVQVVKHEIFSRLNRLTVADEDVKLNLTADFGGDNALFSLKGVISAVGEPVANAAVVAMRDDGEHFDGFVINTGRYGFHNLLPGRYSIFAAAPGCATEIFDLNIDKDIDRKIDLKPGGDLQVKIRSTKNGTIDGLNIEVIDEQGIVIRRPDCPTVWINKTPWGLLAPAVTNEWGEARISGLHPGRHVIGIVGNNATRKPVEIKINEVTMLELSVE